MDKPKNKGLKKFNPNFKKSCIQKPPVRIIRPPKIGKHKLNVKDLWDLYLPDDSYDEHANFKEKLKSINNYFRDNEPSDLKTIADNRYFMVDLNDILRNKMFLSLWPEFLDDLVNLPKKVIGLFGFSMDDLIKKSNICNIDDEDDPAHVGLSYEYVSTNINPRFVGFQNYLPLQDLKLHNYGKFVTIIGTVVRVSDMKLRCTQIAFSCTRCETVQIVVQDKGNYTTPNSCIGEGCSQRVFKPLLQSPYTQTIPIKSIRLQELNTDISEGGRVPRTVECELTSDLTDMCMPGDTVAVSGIVTATDNEHIKIGEHACSYVLYVAANSIVCHKGGNVPNIDSSGFPEIKSEDLSIITRIHSEKNLFRLIVASLCPNIYGHELIKAGLILGLFGGRDKTSANEMKQDFSIRENSHILIVGDPGLGKSQMLLACANVSPRGVYVCGNSTTSSGLTVTISKDGSENSLEAGALVLADQGHCCIDEFDKMMNQHSALLEAMEQQTISVAKSGVVCTLPARTSILAAANPVGGHYNKAKTVSENLKIGGSLLSRFDLVFIVQDCPDQELDSKMSKHVMGLHNSKLMQSNQNCASSYFPPNDNFFKSNGKLLDLLRIEANEKLNLIPPTMLQKYIAYARKFSQPKLKPETSKILQDFYLDIRKQHKLSYSLPITTRQLESLIRLTEARARVELRADCTVQDAEEVVEIMKYSMRETYSDEHGNIDFDRSIHGSGMSKASQAKRLVSVLTKLASTRGDDCFTVQEIHQVAKSSRISADSVDLIIAALNDQGFLLKKGYQLFKVQTV